MDTARFDIERRVFRVVAETFPEADIALNADAMLRRDLGADSMQIIAFMIALDAEFDAEFDAEEIPSADVSLGWICDFVCAKVTGAFGDST